MAPAAGTTRVRVRRSGRALGTPASLRRGLVAGALSLALLTAGACSGSDRAGDEESPVLTRAQRDSVAARLPVPGASGVGAALRARDALDDRATAHDSIGR